MSQLIDNLADVRRRIAAAAAKSGRSPDEVSLVAATKYVTGSMARLLFDAGCRDFGESRPQQLWAKAAELSDLPIRWHLIGHLQRNKVERTLPLVSLVHSADSLRLIAAIDHAAAAIDRVAPVLLEVNISGEPAKHGFSPGEVAARLDDVAGLSHVQIRGLMAMAGLEGDSESARREFAALRELRDRLRPMQPPKVSLDELSMGMSGDFEAAIEEGATIVRVGSALFQGVDR